MQHSPAVTYTNRKSVPGPAPQRATTAPSSGPVAKPSCMQLCTSENAKVRRWSATRLLAAA